MDEPVPQHRNNVPHNPKGNLFQTKQSSLFTFAHFLHSSLDEEMIDGLVISLMHNIVQRY